MSNLQEYDRIFICYSPVHIYIAECLSRSSENTLLIVDTELATYSSPASECFSRLVLHIPSFMSSFRKKIFWLAYYLILPLRLSCSALYIPNSGHHFVQALSRGISSHTLNYIDEGNTCLSLIRHSRIKQDSSNLLIRKLLSLFRISVSSSICDHRFSSYFVFNPDLFFNLTGYNNIFSIPAYPYEIPSISLLPTPNYPVLLYLGSPLSENGWSDYQNQEVDILESYLDSQLGLSDFFLLIKPHYREAAYKYSRLADKYPNLLFFGSNQPSQFLVNLDGLTTVIGFHSSALFGFLPNTAIVSFITLINSQHAKVLRDGLLVLKQHYPQLSFFTN